MTHRATINSPTYDDRDPEEIQEADFREYLRFKKEIEDDMFHGWTTKKAGQLEIARLRVYYGIDD